MKIILFIYLVLVVSDAQAQYEVQTGAQIADVTPYYCTLRRYNDALVIWGAGTIISARHILTAATLVAGYFPFNVGVGSNRRDQLLYYNTEAVEYHPKFMKADRSFNFAILILEHSLTFNAFVQSIALPPLTVDGPQINEQGTIVAFSYGNVLKKTFQRVINETVCPMAHYFPEISSFCAEDEEYNSATNCIDRESGVAFVVKHFGVDTIMGLASQSMQCSIERQLEYARIANARDWIQEVTGI